MHLALLVVGQGVGLQPLFHHFVGDDNGAGPSGIDNELKDVEQLAGIAAAVAHEGCGLLQLYAFRLEF